jgi:EAL and modified HD-GYP domain-containing signal transduction protein
MFGFFDRWFGAEAQAGGAGPVAPRAFEPSVTRDAVLSAEERLAGYRFAPDADGLVGHAAAQANFDTLRANRVRELAEHRLALIVLDHRQWGRFDYPALVGRRTVFQIHPPRRGDDVVQWRRNAAAIRAAGAGIALAGADLARDRELIAQFADLLVFDFEARKRAEFAPSIAQLKRSRPRLQLAMDGVYTWAERAACAALGIDHCIGRFAHAPDPVLPGGALTPTRRALIEMLNLLGGGAEPDAIVQAGMREPAAAVKLVAIANSPMLGLSQPVARIEQAVSLGRAHLPRWLAIALFRAGAGAARDQALLETALARARLLESVGHMVGGIGLGEELFQLGLLSQLDALLGVPAEELPARLGLPAPLADALAHGEGRLGPFLRLALAAQDGQGERVGRLAAELGIAPGSVAAAYGEALLWAELALRLLPAH